MARRRRGVVSRWADRQIARGKTVRRENEKRREHQAVLERERVARGRTAAVRAREVELRELLLARPRDLRARRGEVAELFRRDGALAVVEVVEQLLAGAERLDRFPRGCQVGYEPEARALRVRYELPTLENTVPDSVRSRYVKTTGKVQKVARRPAERHAMYRQALARTTLRALADVFDVAPPDLVNSAVVNGYVATTDPSTGHPAEFTLVSVRAGRKALQEVNLTDPAIDPERCLLRFKARLSRQPQHLIPVRSVVPWVDLSKHRVVNRDDLAAHGRMDLLELSYREFEELVRELFENMGFAAWRTADSHDEGIDVHAVVEDEITGMECVVQAKRYRQNVKPDFVRSLHGALEDQNAHKGFLVTTAWFGSQSYDYAARNRIELISGRRLRELLRDHLGIDAVIPLGKLPRGWHPDDIA